MGPRSTSSRIRQSATQSVANWSLRRKLALVLAIPLLLAVVLGGMRVRNDLVEASNSSTSADQVMVLGPSVDYLNATERAMVAATATTVDTAQLGRALTEVRRTGDALQRASETSNLTAEQRYQVDVILELSRALRDDRATTQSGATFVAQLRQLQSGTTRLISAIANEQITPLPELEVLSQAVTGRFSLAMQEALAGRSRSGAGALELFAELGVEGAAIERIANSQAGVDPVVVADMRTANAERYSTVRTESDRLGRLDAYADYEILTTQLLEDIDNELASAARNARAFAFVNALFTAGALALTILLALAISGMLLNPIRRVREAALSVAHEELPETVRRIRAGEEPGEVTTIDVSTTEEIGQLARAVDDLHRQAVTLAAGEADLRAQVSDMFVTLSRRNTSLVNQQLGLIERLEQDEEDPKRLESLFRLDHLASRMRRTADSLLILADAPTLSLGNEGITVTESMQAATAGVQDYQRVVIGSVDTTRIAEAAAADVIHLLTELVDNALAFSPPSSDVRVGSEQTARGVVITVKDGGLGIPADELAALNATLASGGEVSADAARRMGLFVVSRLSQRHGLTTRLESDTHGTTATVLLPLSVLPDLSPVTEPEDTQDDAVEQVAEVQAPAPISLVQRVPQPLAEPAPVVEPEPVVAAEPEPVTEPEPAVEPERSSLARERAALAQGLLPRRTPGSEPVPGAVDASPAPLMGRREPAPVEPEPTPAPAPVESEAPAPAPVEEPAPVAETAPATAVRERASASLRSVKEVRPSMAAQEKKPSRGFFGLTKKSQADLPPDSADFDVNARIDAALGLIPRAQTNTIDAPDSALAALASLRPMRSGLEQSADVVTETNDAAWLPHRRPGGAAQDSIADQQIAPQASDEPVPAEQSAEEPAAEQLADEPVPVAEESAPVAPEPIVIPASLAEEPVAEEQVDEVPPPVAPLEHQAGLIAAAHEGPSVEETLPTLPVRQTDALDGDWKDSGESSPILDGLRSAWLSTDGDRESWNDSEIQSGWQVAEQAVEESSPLDGALPTRRPGARLVPGGVTETAVARVRDPEALRNRLAAHAAGVTRGRAAVTGSTTPHPSQEADE